MQTIGANISFLSSFLFLNLVIGQLIGLRIVPNQYARPYIIRTLDIVLQYFFAPVFGEEQIFYGKKGILNKPRSVSPKLFNEQPEYIAQAGRLCVPYAPSLKTLVLRTRSAPINIMAYFSGLDPLRRITYGTFPNMTVEER